MDCEILAFGEQHEGGVKQCFAHLQDVEASLEPDRLHSSSELADRYLEYLRSQCQLNAGRIFVAVVEARVVGFVAIWRGSDAENMITSLHSFAYISDIVVLPDFQRRGIAGSLMAAAEKHSKSLGVTHCKVGVLANNQAAIELYKSRDFRPHEMTLIKDL